MIELSVSKEYLEDLELMQLVKEEITKELRKSLMIHARQLGKTKSGKNHMHNFNRPYPLLQWNPEICEDSPLIPNTKLSVKQIIDCYERQVYYSSNAYIARVFNITEEDVEIAKLYHYNREEFFFGKNPS